MGDRGRGFRGGYRGGRGRPQEQHQQQEVRRPAEPGEAHQYNRPTSGSELIFC